MRAELRETLHCSLSTIAHGGTPPPFGLKNPPALSQWPETGTGAGCNEWRDAGGRVGSVQFQVRGPEPAPTH